MTSTNNNYGSASPKVLCAECVASHGPCTHFIPGPLALDALVNFMYIIIHLYKLSMHMHVHISDVVKGFICCCLHRRIYDVLTYVFFFFNVIFGVVMCFLRVFGVFIFTMVMLFRLDWDVYMRGLEGWDTGKCTYRISSKSRCTSKSRRPRNLATYFSQHILIKAALEMSPHGTGSTTINVCARAYK